MLGVGGSNPLTQIVSCLKSRSKLDDSLFVTCSRVVLIKAIDENSSLLTGYEQNRFHRQLPGAMNIYTAKEEEEYK